MNRLLLASILALIVMALPQSTPAQEFKRGAVMDRLDCAADPSQSYALYLPSNYTPARTWPIIYCFDPMARGRVPVEIFAAAAEKYGYIVAGSNNSRNGPWEPIAAAAQAMFSDTLDRLSIDARRVHLAGFSGGARAAARLGYGLEGRVAGVIACGAGFPQGLSPSTSTPPFAVFATSGVEDFNLGELKLLEDELEKAGARYRVEYFEGAHNWPPSGLAVEIVEWLELNAMKAGAREVADGLVAALFDARLRRARSLEERGDVYDAYREFRASARDFGGLVDASAFEAAARRLEESGAAEAGARAERKLFEEERRRSLELRRLRGRLRGRGELPFADEPAAAGSGQQPVRSHETGPDDESRFQALSDLKKAVSELRKAALDPETSPSRAMARRVLNRYFARSFDTTMMLFQAKRYADAVEFLKTESEIVPDDPRTLFNLACAYGLKGDRKNTLKALKKAAEKGFDQPDELLRSPALTGVRDDPEFRRIVEGLKSGR